MVVEGTVGEGTVGEGTVGEGTVVEGTVVAGHGVASGSSPSSPFPAGTIELQAPHFAQRGLDLSDLHPATINIDLAPHAYALREPRVTFPDVHWTDVHGAETFSFLRCRLVRLPTPAEACSEEGQTHQAGGGRADRPRHDDQHGHDIGRDNDDGSRSEGLRTYKGWVYYPHPETKPMHEQPPSVLEVLMPHIDGLAYGDRVLLRLDAAEIDIYAAKDTRTA